MKTKTCTHCHETKPATQEHFAKQSKSRDGLHTYCRYCLRAIAREQKRRERARETSDDPTPIQPITREPIAPGITRIKFGHGWKPNRATHPLPGLTGYTSAITRIY